MIGAAPPFSWPGAWIPGARGTGPGRSVQLARGSLYPRGLQPLHYCAHRQRPQQAYPGAFSWSRLMTCACACWVLVCRSGFGIGGCAGAWVRGSAGTCGVLQQQDMPLAWRCIPEEELTTACCQSGPCSCLSSSRRRVALRQRTGLSCRGRAAAARCPARRRPAWRRQRPWAQPCPAQRRQR